MCSIAQLVCIAWFNTRTPIRPIIAVILSILQHSTTLKYKIKRNQYLTLAMRLPQHPQWSRKWKTFAILFVARLFTFNIRHMYMEVCRFRRVVTYYCQNWSYTNSLLQHLSVRCDGAVSSHFIKIFCWRCLFCVFNNINTEGGHFNWPVCVIIITSTRERM